MTADVIIIGAGIVGCAIARKLAREGLDVVVVDRDEPGSHASWAAAGMLSPQAESEGPDTLLPFLLQARSLFPSLAEELHSETGLDVGYSTRGMLLVGFTPADESRLREKLAWQREAGLEVEELTGNEAKRLEPILSPAVRFALRFSGDHQIDNRVLVRALRLSAGSAGARFLVGRAVHRLGPATGGMSVDMEDGRQLTARWVVLAAGSWSGTIEGTPRPIPVEPVHGQLLSFNLIPPTVRHTVGSPRGYLVPRADGRLIVGTTVERTGFSKEVTPAGLQSITSIALEIAPTLADLPVTDHWSGLRPGTPDGLPILGPDPDLPSLLYATGHYRNGILLAPLTAELIAGFVTGNRTDVDLTPFRADRFGA